MERSSEPFVQKFLKDDQQIVLTKKKKIAVGKEQQAEK
jgi:hypothetical protein